MAKRKPKTPQSETPRQDGIGTTGIYGGAYWGNGHLDPVKNAATGVTMLPPVAAVVGSGALEGRNPYAGYFGGMHAGAIGGMGMLPGYPIPLPGTYALYRLMLHHPTIALVRSLVTWPIVGSKWSYEPCNDAPEGAAELVEKVFERHRTRLLLTMLRAIDIGFAPIEVVWGELDGATVPVKFKELLPELSILNVDNHGNLAGISNMGVVLDDPSRFMVYTHDRLADNHYGQSRLENCKRAWANWLTDEDQLGRLNAKAAGIIGKIGFPPDDRTRENGNATNADGSATNASNYAKALALARATAQGQWSVFQNQTAKTMEAIANGHIELAGKSMWSIDLMDMGNCGPAQSALLEAIRYRDALICRGYLRSERAVVEAQTSGSRADSEQHTASGDNDCDQLHADIVQTINDGPVRELLIQNFGEDCAECVRIRHKEIVDENRVIDGKMLDAMLKGESSASEVFSRVDMDGFMKRNGIKLHENAEDWESAEWKSPDPVMDESKLTSQQDEETKARKELSAALFSESAVAA